MVKTSFEIFWSNAKGGPQRQPQGQQRGTTGIFLKNSNTVPNYCRLAENCQVHFFHQNNFFRQVKRCQKRSNAYSIGGTTDKDRD
jgi:hypothetical protein